MSVEPDLRIALAFVLLLRWASPWFAAKSPIVGEIEAWQAEAARRSRWPRYLTWALWILPLLPFLIAGESPFRWLSQILSQLPPSGRPGIALELPILAWLNLIIAVGCLLATIWLSKRAPATPYQAPPSPASEPTPTADSQTRLSTEFWPAPYRVVRYPQWSIDALLVLVAHLLAISIDSTQVVLLATYSLGCCALVWFVLPQEEIFWQRYCGSRYGEFIGRTGRLLPQLPQIPVQGRVGYVVPQRFGMSAIIALVTMFAVMFGILNAFQAQITEIKFMPITHAFFGTLLLVVWVGQMRFPDSARMVSALAGAVLLPAFAVYAIQPATSQHVGFFVFTLGPIGGLIGYCMGATAAGFFLFAAWIGPHLPGGRSRS